MLTSSEVHPGTVCTLFCTAAITTTRSKTLPGAPGGSVLGAPDEGFGLEGTPKPKIQRDPYPQKGNPICWPPLYGKLWFWTTHGGRSPGLDPPKPPHVPWAQGELEARPNTAAATTTRSTFQIDDPSRCPGGSVLGPPDEGFGLEGTPKPKIQRDPSPPKRKPYMWYAAVWLWIMDCGTCMTVTHR